MKHYKAPDNSLHCIEDDVEASSVAGFPVGAVLITSEEAEELRPKPDASAIIDAKKQAIRQVREGILNRLAGIAFAAQLSGDDETTEAYLVVRQGLLDITDALPTDPELVDSEVMSRYAALVIQCTPEMVSAFAAIDQ